MAEIFRANRTSAPERNIQSTPFKTSRSARRYLSRVATTGNLSNNGSIKDHCSLVNSSRRAISEVYQTIFEMASSNQSAKRYTQLKNPFGFLKEKVYNDLNLSLFKKM
jgi:hypothetical protein